MKLKIEFFKEDLVDAIGAGIYEIDVYHNGKIETLYIGESIFVLVRCASHLFNMVKNPSYFGFTDNTIENSDITLNFHLLEQENDMKIRKQKEKQYIANKSPISQSGISDRQKNREQKIEALTNFLNESE